MFDYYLDMSLSIALTCYLNIIKISMEGSNQSNQIQNKSHVAASGCFACKYRQVAASGRLSVGWGPVRVGLG